MKRQKGYIMLSVLLCCLLAGWMDGVVRPGYVVKTGVKILLFFGFPMAFFLTNREAWGEFRNLFSFKGRGFLSALLLGVGVYGVILGGYFLTRGLIDFSRVTADLTAGMGITAGNFLYVSLYISFVNSFLEEFFFRGYAFITLKQYGGRKFAYLFSALAFGLYHGGMLAGMFPLGVLPLLLLGLMAGGCLFDFLNERHGTIYPSWFVHMFANFAINTVGGILFGLL